MTCTINPVLFRLKVVASSVQLRYVLSLNRLKIIMKVVGRFDTMNVQCGCSDEKDEYY